jgi:hypothetical protein
MRVALVANFVHARRHEQQSLGCLVERATPALRIADRAIGR